MTGEAGASSQSKPDARSRLRLFGPGLIMAVSGIGASDVISATVGGATYGTTLLWALVLGAFFKFVLSEGLARWQLATGTTVLQGWAKYLPRWVLVVFFVYLVFWAVAVSGALISGCALALENLSAGRISFRMAAIAHVLGGFAAIWLLGERGPSAVIKPLVGVMSVTVVGCAMLTFPSAGTFVEGLFVPRIPVGAGGYVLSLVGGIGGSLTLLTYNYLLRDEGRVDPQQLRAVRYDLASAYLFTAVFGLSVMLIAARVFYTTGIPITNNAAVSRMATQLADFIGPFGFYLYSVGFWAAVLASLLGVWQAVPHIFSDCWILMRGGGNAAREKLYYARALVFMAAVAIPFAFVRQPLFFIIAFTVLGSLFIPFLAATLLHLNNRVPWTTPVPHNRPLTNGVLVLVLLVFLVVAALELVALL